MASKNANTKLYDAPCNIRGYLLQNLIFSVLKRSKTGKVYDYHTGACMIFIQSARQSLGKLGRTLIILYFRLTIKHTNPPIT